jgi:hypothetical protein
MKRIRFTGGAAIGITAGIFFSFMGVIYCYLGLISNTWWILIGASFELFLGIIILIAGIRIGQRSAEEEQV